jgi:hypothetical protein
VKKRTADQTKLLKAWPRVNQLSAGSLYLYDTTYKTKHAAELKAMSDAAARGAGEEAGGGVSPRFRRGSQEAGGRAGHVHLQPRPV